MVRGSIWLGGVLLALASSCAVTSRPAPVGRHALFVLGIAQDGGVPHVGCERDCCVEARRSGDARLPVALGLHDRVDGRLLLVEATPAIDAQIALLHRLAGVSGRARRPVDGVLITHAHIGHYLGLAQFGREVAGTSGVELFVSPRMTQFLQDNGPWSQLFALGQVRAATFTPGEPFTPAVGITVEPIAVPHRDEFSDTMAFKIRGPQRTVLFVPDVDRWQSADGLLQRLLEGVDVAYVDGTFYDGRELPDRDLNEIPHPLIVDTMQRLAEHARARPGSVRFIHLNHTNPLLRDARLRAEVERRGFRVAEGGEWVEL